MVRIGMVGLAAALVSGVAAVGCKTELTTQNPGTGGASGCNSDLSGTWDVMATSLTVAHTWVMTIGATTFSMSNASGALVYTDGATKQLSSTRGATVTPVSVTNVPAALNAGSLPLALGGSWTFAANNETCTVNVAANAASGSCQGPGGPGSYVGTSNWPYPLLSPMHGRTYTATRMAQLPSQLGDLGGQWALSNGAAASCTATVEGNRINAICTNAQPLTGNLQLTLGNDCVASGVSGGYELSARRR